MLSFLLTSCDALMNWQTEFPDNIVEESIEDFIEDQTGKDIDLTPLTGEETLKFKKNK